MKIFYHHRIRSKDGQYVHIEELTNALRALGHQIIMVGPSAVSEEQFGAEARAVAILKRNLPGFLYELLEFGYAFIDYVRLARAVKRHRPDCLYERYNLLLPSGAWVRRRYRLPMVLEVNAPLFEERSRYGGITLRRLAKWSERVVWRNADYVLPVTEVLAGHVRRSGVADDRIVVIPNGIDPQRFGRVPDVAQAKRALGLEGRLVLGFVGFMREWHGLEAVVDLLCNDEGKPRHFLLLGDGPARASIERRARERGVSGQVTITGVVGRDRVADHIAAFDVALQPQVVAYASPLKLFEYLALGRAIVAPATPNIQEILRDGENALLFDPGDPAAFAGAVERLCRDAPLRARLAARAAETIMCRGLTWRHNAMRVEELFRRLGVMGTSPGAQVPGVEVPRV